MDDHAALLSVGRISPSVMPIDSPHGSHIRRKRQLLGGATAPKPAWYLPWDVAILTEIRLPRTRHSRMLLQLACLPLPFVGPPEEDRTDSFGCSVNLPLGSRSVDPHSTAVGVETCSTPVLNRTQQEGPISSADPRWSTRYYNQDLRLETLRPGAAPTGPAVSSAALTQ